jgi:NhaP-type Na+/H+ or K+/H+ antiporter/Trk K+ transport system NAD-binding subunit
MEGSHDLVITAASILVVAVVGQVIAQRTRVPTILLFLGAGVLLGPIGFSLISPQNLGVTLEAAIKLFVAIIVFEGAFSLEWTYLRIVSRTVRNLVTVGAAVTLAVGSLAAHYVGGLSWSISLLFAALVMVTGPTVITPLLQRVRVTGRTRATLSGEGVVIDPIGAVIVLLIFETIEGPGTDLGEGVVEAVSRIGIGAVIGLIGGILTVLWMRYFASEVGQVARLSLLAAPAAIFTISDSLTTESGLAAVVAAGLVAGNAEFPHKEEAHQFKGDVTALIIASVYLLLAATLEPEDLTRLGWRGPAVVLILMVVARPLGVFLSTWRSPLTLRERIFVAGIGPRGVVAASLATFVTLTLRDENPDEAASLLGLVFLTIAITTAVQATYANWLANRLGVRPMGVLIVGGGRVGRMLAERLISTGEDVSMIELDAEKAELARKLGVSVIVGDATNTATMEKAGVKNAHTVVATTRSDKDNLLACQIARTRYGREHVVSRVTDPESLPSFEELGIRVMNPAAATATILSNLVRRPSIFGLLTGSAANDADITEVVVASDAVAGKALKDLKIPGDSLVMLIRREGRRMIPHGDSLLAPGDVLTIVGTNGATERAREYFAGHGRID